MQGFNILFQSRLACSFSKGIFSKTIKMKYPFRSEKVFILSPIFSRLFKNLSLSLSLEVTSRMIQVPPIFRTLDDSKRN